ncbi:MAG: gliding motility-associated C-terminal domain-containing protein, partial [Luteibaculum sp.]
FSNGTFSWSFSPFIQTGQLSQAQPTTLPLDTSTVFSLTYSEGGCSKTVQQSVAVEYMGQMLQHKNPMLVCEPDKGEKLIAYTNGIGVSYKWSTNPGFNPLLNSNASDSIITYFPNNVYSEIYLEVSSINGCVYNEQLVVSALTALPGITSKDTVCLGDTVLLKVDASFLAIPPDVVYWEPSSKMDSIPAQGDSINYFANEVGTVSAHFYFQGGCVRSISKYIQFSPIHYHYPEIINTKSSLFPDEPFSLIVQNPDPKIKYQWIPAGLDQNDSLAEQSYRSNDSLKQVQLLLDDGLCTRSVYFSLKQEELKCAEPFVPNAFSPNGDLENDVLFVRGKNLEAVSLSIYDRWGQEVFSTQNQQLGWNGTFEDKPLHPGIYVYSLKARCVSGELFTKSGNITLLR